jgi:perosamine synthetase
MNNPSKYLGNELKYLKKVLNAKSWSATGGNWNQTLEQKFAEKFKRKYAIAFNSGTSTLHAALEAIGVGPGDEVISPAFTVIMDTTATLHANAIPVYADINLNTFTIDPKDIEKKITSKTKAIITVAIYGLSPDMDKIMKIAKKHNLFVIEDNAQAVLSYYKNKLLGTIGDMASFSFENTKHISCGEGGMLITNNNKYAKLARQIGGHGFKNLKAKEGRIKLNQDIFQNPYYKRHDILGWNYRLSEFNAAVALAQLERIDELVELRKKSACLFKEVMQECNYLIPQYTPSYSINSYYTLGVVYRGEEERGVSWENFRKMYLKEGGDGIYGAWSVPYLEPMVVNNHFLSRYPIIINQTKGACPNAEEIQPKIMQFKTNYRDLKLAKFKANLLYKIIKKLKKQ